MSKAVVTEEAVEADIHFVSSVTHFNQTLEKTPAAVTIIDRRTIEASAAVDVLDIFRLVPGFRAYFVNANAPSVSYHAFGDAGSRRLEVKIDGRSVYESIYSSVEWTTLGVELDDIEYIEVVRGANAPADGSNAFLASINIVTRSPLTENGWDVRAQIGTDNIRNRAISYSGKLGELNHRTTIRHRLNDGFSDFAGNYNGQFRQVELEDSAETITFNFKGLFNDSEVGVGERDYVLRQIDYQYQHLNWSRINDSGSVYEFISYHNKFDVTDHQDSLTFYQALNFFPDGPVKNALSQLPDKFIIEPEIEIVSERWDSEFRATFDHGENTRAVYGAAIRRDKVHSFELFNTEEKIAQNSYRGYANVEWNISDKLVANGGLLAEESGDQERISSFRLAGNYQISDSQTLRLAFNRGRRAPTMLESRQSSYRQYDENLVLDAVTIADPDIRAETLLSSELGYSGAFLDDRLNLDVRMFSERMTDVINERRVAYPDFNGQLNIRDNTDTVNTRGIEWQAQYRPNAQLLIHGNYSFVDLTHTALYRTTPVVEIRDLSDINPSHLAAVLVNYVTESDLSLSAMVNYQSRIQHASGIDDEGFTRLDLKVAKKLRFNNSNAEVSFTVQNLGSDYREFYFFNQFSTRYILGLRVGFP